MALQDPGALCCVFSMRFMVQLPQKEGTHGEQPEQSAAPTAYLGGRGTSTSLKLWEALGKHSVITGEKS